MRHLRPRAVRSAAALAVLLLAGCGPSAGDADGQGLGIAELQQALTEVEVSGHQFSPVAAEELQSVRQAQGIAPDLAIEPAGCRELLDESIRLQSGDLARASVVSDSMTVSAVAYPSETDAIAQIEAAIAVVATCPEMTISADGGTSTTVTTGIDSSVEADQVTANTQSTGNADLTLASVTSSARSGPVLVTGTVTSPTTEEAALADLDSAVQQSVDALPTR